MCPPALIGQDMLPRVQALVLLGLASSRQGFKAFSSVLRLYWHGMKIFRDVLKAGSGHVMTRFRAIR